MTTGDHQRLLLLRRASDELAKAGDPRERLARALQLLLTDTCQHVLLDVYGPEGGRTYVTAFGDPELERLALQLTRRYPPKPMVHPKEIALRTGQTVQQDVTDDWLSTIAHDGEHLALLRRFELSQLLVLPLCSKHRALGVLSVSSKRGAPFASEERMVIELLGERIATHLESEYFRRRVLLVEDNPANRYLLKHALLEAGFAVHEADTGAQALQLAHEAKPDVVVLDLHLPDMLGHEVSKRLKSDELTIRIPIIQMSAMFVRPEDRIAARAHGADDFLVAPIEPGNFVATIHAILRESEEASETRRTVERERSARKELEHANAKLRAVAESGLLGTLEWNGRGEVVDANSAFLKMAGRARVDILTRKLTLDGLFTPTLPTLAAPLSAAPMVIERDLVTASEVRTPVMLGVTQLGEPHGAGIAFVLDVTEQRRRAELEALLLGIVSHDLRNPLGVVTMAASMLMMSDDLNDRQRKIVQRLSSAGRQSVRLVSDLLDFTAARRSGIELVRGRRDLHTVVESAIEDLRSAWPQRVIEHERIGDGTAHLDEDRVMQIVLNLLGNALQHSPSHTSVRVETRGESDAVVFCVKNDGAPIPDELMPHLFAPLRRGVGAGQRRGSLGLGLFIVRHLVLAHGGTIEVGSSATTGTCFTFRLPHVLASSVATHATELDMGTAS